MDGLLIVDKPAGPTSHDVVARVRRRFGERRIGHTGTLDPAATGVLPLVVGRATRLARFLAADLKTYEATVRLGFSTDSGDASGQPSDNVYRGALPCLEAVELALTEFRGTFSQTPPAFSAKKINGKRSYRLARRARTTMSPPAVSPAAVPVTAYQIDVLGMEEDTLTLHVTCSSGFYMRALAHDLGVRLGVGAHLTALRRTRSGNWSADQALPLGQIEQPGGSDVALAGLIPLSRMLPDFAVATLTAEGARHAVNGRDLGPDDFESRPSAAARDARGLVRLMNLAGDCLGIAEPTDAPGFLHPSVILV